MCRLVQLDFELEGVALTTLQELQGYLADALGLWELQSEAKIHYRGKGLPSARPLGRDNDLVHFLCFFSQVCRPELYRQLNPGAFL